MLKKLLSGDIGLAYPDFSKSFVLVTDASDSTIGGVLQQTDSIGNNRPLSYLVVDWTLRRWIILLLSERLWLSCMVWRLTDSVVFVIQLKSSLITVLMFGFLVIKNRVVSSDSRWTVAQRIPQFAETVLQFAGGITTAVTSLLMEAFSVLWLHWWPPSWFRPEP